MRDIEAQARAEAKRRQELKAEILALIEKKRDGRTAEQVGYTDPDEKRAKIAAEWREAQRRRTQRIVNHWKRYDERFPEGATILLTCEVCGWRFRRKRSHASTCTRACRTKLSRLRQEVLLRMEAPGSKGEMIARHAALVGDARRVSSEIRWTNKKWSELFADAADELERLSRRAAAKMPESVTGDFPAISRGDKYPPDLLEVQGKRGRRRHQQDYKPFLYAKGNEGRRSSTQG